VIEKEREVFERGARRRRRRDIGVWLAGRHGVSHTICKTLAHVPVPLIVTTNYERVRKACCAASSGQRLLSEPQQERPGGAGKWTAAARYPLTP
jgi:hypothetical protein